MTALSVQNPRQPFGLVFLWAFICVLLISALLVLTLKPAVSNKGEFDIAEGVIGPPMSEVRTGDLDFEVLSTNEHMLNRHWRTASCLGSVFNYNKGSRLSPVIWSKRDNKTDKILITVYPAQITDFLKLQGCQNIIQDSIKDIRDNKLKVFIPNNPTISNVVFILVLKIYESPQTFNWNTSHVFFLTMYALWDSSTSVSPWGYGQEMEKWRIEQNLHYMLYPFPGTIW